MRCSIVSICLQYSQSGFSLGLDIKALLFVQIVVFIIWNEVSLVFEGRLLSCIMLYALLKVSIVGKKDSILPAGMVCWGYFDC